jgi:co-chaperonin GroES (HSP10)
MQPYGNNIIVKPFPPDDISVGGIIVPDSVKKPSNKVKIIKVGEGTEEKPMQLKEGQTAYRVKDWGMDIIVDGELYYLMDAGAILAVE